MITPFPKWTDLATVLDFLRIRVSLLICLELSFESSLFKFNVNVDNFASYFGLRLCQ